MITDKKVYSIKLTDLEKDVVTTLITTTNTNLLNFHWRGLASNSVELKTCLYMADIDEQNDGAIETIGIPKEIYDSTIKRFDNLRKEGLI